MPWPLLFSTKNDVNNLDTSSNSIVIHPNEEDDNEDYNWHELTITERHSLLTSLNRICVYWRQIVFNKIRFVLTLIFVTMLNIATRLTRFTRQKTAVQSASPLSSIVTIPSNRTFENDRNYSSTSLINFNSQVDLPLLESSSMAHMLVQQQTSNINIHQTTSTQNESRLPISRSVDDRLFFYQPDSTSLLEFFQRMASEPQMSKFQTTTNSFLNISNSFLPLNVSDEEEEEEKEVNNANWDKIEPVISEDIKSSELDNISTATILGDLDEDILFNTTSSLNSDRHFRKRKRRSSLTKTSPSTDEIQSIVTDSIEKIDDNNNQTNIQGETNENLPVTALENLSLEEKQDSNEKTTPHAPSRFGRRRLRYRSHRQTSQLPTSDNVIEFSIPTETSDSIPPPSPISPATTASVPSTSPNRLTGGLKRTGSIGSTKKMVRFADSVGRELAQVQYIRSLTDDDDDVREFSNVKNNLYSSSTFNFEHKPWSFDVALSSKQFSHTPLPRRFFCLYRQPNSEHPDIYLHEIWKSQIKLEHTDVRLKYSSTGEQCLYGTLWVTNASYWKNVTVKYTFNRWLNTYEYEAQHRSHSNDFRNIDQFEFSIDIPHDVDRIDFVLRYYVNGQEYWDNNEGKNYTLETESASIPQTTISLPHDCDFNEMRFY